MAIETFGQTAWALWTQQRSLPPKIRVFVDFLAERLGAAARPDLK